MLAAVAFAVLPVRIKELVYGNIQQGDDLVKGVQAWMLAPVLKIHDGTRGTVYELCKVFPVSYTHLCEVCAVNMTECAGTAPEPAPVTEPAEEPEPEPQQKSNTCLLYTSRCV